MDIVGSQLTQTNGNPALPCTTFTGPVTAGNVIHSDGSGNLAGVAGTVGTANQGYCSMEQVAVITQANGTSAGAPNGVATAGVYTTWIVIPAQSQILAIKLMVTTAWSTTTALGIGTTASATALTAANAVTGLGTLGQVAITPGTSLTQIANWDNTGTSDIQIVVTSQGTGNGVGTLSIGYIPGVNNAS